MRALGIVTCHACGWSGSIGPRFRTGTVALADAWRWMPWTPGGSPLAAIVTTTSLGVSSRSPMPAGSRRTGNQGDRRSRRSEVLSWFRLGGAPPARDCTRPSDNSTGEAHERDWRADTDIASLLVAVSNVTHVPRFISTGRREGQRFHLPLKSKTPEERLLSRGNFFQLSLVRLSRVPAPAAAAAEAAAADRRPSPGSPNRPGTSASPEAAEAAGAAEAAAEAAEQRSCRSGSAAACERQLASS